MEIAIRKHRVDDLQKRLSVGDYEGNDPDVRSPSPEPIYDQKTGLRTNTRDVRLRERAIRERLRLIEELRILDPTYVPPPDYRP